MIERINIINKVQVIMSTRTLPCSATRRTSERRKLKMLKNSNEYKVINPFKGLQGHSTLPDDLTHQLKKVDFLSNTAIAMLAFQRDTYPQSDDDLLVQKMREAAQLQSENYALLYGSSNEMETENPENEENEHPSSCQRGYNCAGEQVINTHEQLSIHISPFASNPYDYHWNQEEELNLLQSNPQGQIQINQLQVDNEDVKIIEEEYQDYFVN